MAPTATVDFSSLSGAGATGIPQVGDSLWHYRSDRPAVVVSVDGSQARVVFTLRCCHCRVGLLAYSDQRWCWYCPRCRMPYTDAELRRMVEALTCTTRDCQRPHHARGLRVVCYEAWRRTLPHRRALKRDWQRRPAVKRRRAAAERRAYAAGRRSYRRRRDAA